MRVFKDDSTFGKWYVDYFFQGKRIRYPAGSSQQAANKLRIRIESEINLGTHDPDKVRAELKGRTAGMTLGELTDLFLELYRSKGLSGYYKQRSKVYLRLLGRETSVASIGPLQVEKFRNELEAEGYGNATIRKQLISLGTVFRWAIAKGIVKDNPADPVRVRRPSEPPPRDLYLNQHQVRELLLTCEPPLRRLVHFLVETGSRLSEPLNLKWSDIDKKAGWINIYQGKSAKVKRFPYTELLQAIVGSEPRKLHSEFVFSKPDGTKLDPNAMSKEIKRAMRRINLPAASAHSLRHTFASRLAMRGIAMQMIANLLGQSSAWVAQRYTHLTPEVMQRTMRDVHDGVPANTKEETDDTEGADASRIPRGS